MTTNENYTPHPPGRSTEVLSHDEVLLMLAKTPKRGRRGKCQRAMVVTMWRAGLRVSECLGVLPSHLRPEQMAIHVVCGKGGRERYVALDPKAWRCLDQWAAWRVNQDFGPTVPLFSTLAGKPMGRDAVWRFVKRLAEKAKIQKRIHPHTLRHTCAFELANEGVPLHVIQKILGHARLATTQIYLSHLVLKDLVEVARNREW